MPACRSSWITISTDVCHKYYENKGKLATTREAVEGCGQSAGKNGRAEARSGDNPLLVSVPPVRSFSIAGHDDTVLNLGLNEATVKAIRRSRQRTICLGQLSPFYSDVRIRLFSD